jgi:hypothetical protein
MSSEQTSEHPSDQMNEEPTEEEKAWFIQSAEQIPEGFLVIDSFWAIDATMAMLIYHTPFGETARSIGTNFVRMERAPGFVLWFARDTEMNEYGAIGLRMIDNERVLINVYKGPMAVSGPPENIASVNAFLRHLMAALLRSRKDDLEQMEKMAERTRDMAGNEEIHPNIASLFKHMAPPPRPGRPKADDNRWAQQEIAAGRDYNSTLGEWMRRRNVDMSNPRTVRQARDLFRKTVAKREEGINEETFIPQTEGINGSIDVSSQ